MANTAANDRLCQVDGCQKPHRWFTDPGLYLCDEHSKRVLDGELPAETLRRAAPLLRRIIDGSSYLPNARAVSLRHARLSAGIALMPTTEREWKALALMADLAETLVHDDIASSNVGEAS